MCSWHNILLSLCFFSLFISVFSFGIGKRIGIRIDRFESCKYTPKTPFLWEEVLYENLPNGTVRVQSKGTITRDVPKFTAQVIVKRCSAKESLDSCQPFAKLNPLNTCTVLEMKGMVWTGIVEAFEPELKCPLKAGLYTSRNQTMDPNMAFLVPIDDWYWKIIFRIKDVKEFTDICLDFQGYIVHRV